MMAVKRNKSCQSAAGSERPALNPLQQALLEEANLKVTIVSDGQQKEVSIDQVVSRKLLQMAASEINAAQQLQPQQGLLYQATNNCVTTASESSSTSESSSVKLLIRL
ncbi:MAG: hypothetical protein ABJL55_03880 [Roseibium sp.]